MGLRPPRARIAPWRPRRCSSVPTTRTRSPNSGGSSAAPASTSSPPPTSGLVLEVPEDGETFEENARAKARAFCEASGLPTLADDSGIEVDALDGAPGVRSARYGDPSLDDAGRMRLLLARLADVPAARRSCRYRIALVVASPDGTEETAGGVCEGTVAFEPAGSNGFGYDPIFSIPALGKTVAQLDPARKDAVSHRGQAARRIAVLLGTRAHAGVGR